MTSGGMSQLDISGIFPPIPTPFRDDEEINYESLESNLTKWNATKVRGYLVQGSNGEYCYLDMDERLQMVKKVETPNGLGSNPARVYFMNLLA
jgi:4-hydroxy-2-oxoglutarate aldolase